MHTRTAWTALFISLLLLSCEEKATDSNDTDPVVSISSPADGQTFFSTETVAVSVAASDDKGITKVELYVNGITDIARTVTEAPFIIQWRPPVQSADSVHYSLFVKAYDADGHAASSAIRSITVYLLRPPTELAIGEFLQQIRLEWKDNSSNETGFQLFTSTDEVNYTLLTSVGKNITSVLVDRPVTETKYKVRASAGSVGSPFSNIITIAGFIPVGNLFPLISGRRLEYSGYFTQSDTETPVAGTSAYYSASMTIGSQTPFTAVFGPLLGSLIAANNGGRSSAVLIYDTTVMSQAGTKKLTPFFCYVDSATGDLFSMINLGLFFRSVVIKDSAAGSTRKDSLMFIKLSGAAVQTGSSFIAFERTYLSYSNPAAPTSISVRFTGNWQSTEQVTVNGVTYQTFYLTVTRTVFVGSTPVAVGTVGKYWFAHGIGPVKMFIAGDMERQGEYRELKAKNF